MMCVCGISFMLSLCTSPCCKTLPDPLVVIPGHHVGIYVCTACMPKNADAQELREEAICEFIQNNSWKNALKSAEWQHLLAVGTAVGDGKFMYNVL